MVTRFIVIISQYIQILKHYIIHSKLMLCYGFKKYA